ncbi:hypothetical protein ABPG74_000097 [Tetrahymena malaccensis]
MTTKSRKSKTQMEEMNTPEQDEFEQKKKKIEEILQKALDYTQKLILHRKEASKQAIQQTDDFKSKKKESKRKHDREQQQQINKEERIMQRKSTGSENDYTYLTVQPNNIQFGVLKNYQMNGLNWLIQLYELKMNGILADDMGLGKTIQTIAMVAFLKQFKHINGKHLIIGPLATLNNWLNEFTRWLPCCKATILYATEEERNKTLQDYVKSDKFEVIITSYEGIKKSASDLQKIQWEYMIVDEAHKLKNDQSQLSLLLRKFKTKNRLLLTGTPLQNDIHELISLLNFVMPQIFTDCDTFDEFLTSKKKNKSESSKQQENNELQNEEFNQEDNLSEIDKQKMELVKKLHQIITPFMLRRTKEESLKDLPPKKEIHLYVGLSDLQLKMYRNILLNKTIDSVFIGDQKRNYNNTLMQLRKVCIHPYLFDGVEDRSLPEYGDHLVYNSGKMVVLDKLLKKLYQEKEKAHQVLVFTQFTTCLDILEDYLIGKNWNYCRIDGNTEVNEREQMMNEFQRDDSDKFVFLLSTRAGGLGINLTKANFVVIFDSDFNPQIDLQAMDRAYRIGQVREVKVIRLITQFTVEEKIIERQAIKLKLDQLIIQSGRSYSTNFNLEQHNIKNITQYGADEIFKAKGSTISDDDIDMILAKGEKKTDEQNREIQKLVEEKMKGLFDLEVKSIKCKELFGEDPRLQDEIAIKQAALQSELEEKKKIYEEQIKKNKLIKVKVIQLPEYQLFESKARLEQLLQKEEEYLARGGIMYKVGLYSEEFIQNMAKNNGLTDDELKEKEQLMQQGFPYWDANDYKEFLRASYLYGRGDFEKIAIFMNKPLDEVRDYHRAFWQRGEKCISNFNYIQKKVETTDKNIQMAKEYTDFVKMKMDDSEYIQENIIFDSKIYKKYSSYKHSLDRDQLIINSFYKYGYGEWERILYDIQNNVSFSLDENFRMMRESDIKARARQLFNILKAENDNQLLGIRQRQIQLKKMQEESKQNKKGGKKIQKQDGESSNNSILSRSSADKDGLNKIKPTNKEAKKDQNRQKLVSEKPQQVIEDDIENIDKKKTKKENQNKKNAVDKQNVNQKDQEKQQKQKVQSENQKENKLDNYFSKTTNKIVKK